MRVTALLLAPAALACPFNKGQGLASMLDPVSLEDFDWEAAVKAHPHLDPVRRRLQDEVECKDDPFGDLAKAKIDCTMIAGWLNNECDADLGALDENAKGTPAWHICPAMCGKCEGEWQEMMRGGPTPELIPKTGPDMGGNGRTSMNGFMTPTLTAQLAPNLDYIELVAMWGEGTLPGKEDAPGVGEELCVWNFQSLPPPQTLDDSVETMPRTVNGESQGMYLYPKNDHQKMIDLCDLASSRLQAHVADPDALGSVVLAGCLIGSQAAKAACEWGMKGESSDFCGPEAVDDEVAWPQAVTMFKITRETAAKFREILTNWRSSPDQHLPHIIWAFSPGYEDMSMNKDHGGLVGANNAGWGNNGGLRRKVMPCKDIPDIFKYPKGPNGDYKFGSEAVFDDAYYMANDKDNLALNPGLTFMENAWRWWDAQCSIPFVDYAPGSPEYCEYVPKQTPAPVSAPSEEPEGPASSSYLDYSETCRQTSDYISNEITCGTNIAEQWGDNSIIDDIGKMLETGYMSCGADFCKANGLEGAGFGIDATTGLLGCEGLEVNECVAGERYVDALMEFQKCAVNLDQAVSQKKKFYSEESKHPLKDKSASACAFVEDCDKRTLESVTDDFRVQFCINFFQHLQDPFYGGLYSWVPGCGYTGNGDIGTGAYEKCFARVHGDTDGKCKNILSQSACDRRQDCQTVMKKDVFKRCIKSKVKKVKCGKIKDPSECDAEDECESVQKRKKFRCKNRK